MAGIGYITTGSSDTNNIRLELPTDESVCGLLFDYSDYYSGLDSTLVYENFKDEQVQLINSLDDAEALGLFDNGFMNNVPYYHIKQYYEYIGGEAPLYICFTTDWRSWGAILKMQHEAEGRLFQVGVWTTKPLWQYTEQRLQFTNLISSLQSATDEVCGRMSEGTLCPTPLSVVVSPNTANIGISRNISLREIPDGRTLNAPKISVCLMQNDTADVHKMQSLNPDNTPVGCIGLLMACLHLAYAEESIGYVKKFNLNKDNTVDNAGIAFGGRFYSVDDVSYTLGNILAQKGYILPCRYNGKEAEVFFGNDATLSDGDYQCIANNRVMHKVRRCVKNALFPFVHSNQVLDGTNISSSAQSTMTQAVIDSVNSTMLNPMQQRQVGNVEVQITDSSNILSDDRMQISVSIGLVNYSSVINERDEFEN